MKEWRWNFQAKKRWHIPFVWCASRYFHSLFTFANYLCKRECKLDMGEKHFMFELRCRSMLVVWMRALLCFSIDQRHFALRFVVIFIFHIRNLYSSVCLALYRSFSLSNTEHIHWEHTLCIVHTYFPPWSFVVGAAGETYYTRLAWAIFSSCFHWNSRMYLDACCFSEF